MIGKAVKYYEIVPIESHIAKYKGKVYLTTENLQKFPEVVHLENGGMTIVEFNNKFIKPLEKALTRVV